MNILKLATICLVSFFISFTANADDTFNARFAGQQTIGGINTIAVTFSEALDPKQNLDAYLSIFTDTDHAVDGAWVLSEDPRIIFFSNIISDTSYVINIHKGLKSATGRTLETPREFRVKTRPVQPMISFDGNGFILASKLSRGLPVNTLNIDRADIDFFKVNPDSYAGFTELFSRSGRMSYYRSKDLRNFSELVYSGRWDLEINKGLRTPVNIPITHIREISRPGIYFAVLRGAGHYDYAYSSTWFTISDLGLHIRTYANALQVHVQSLETAEPVKGAIIDGFDKNGRQLIHLESDENGTARFNGNVDRLKFIVARSESNITFVPMDIPAVDLSEFRTATEPFRPVDLFVYGPRDLYRPGETVVFDGLLRDRDGEMTAGVPITAEIIRPDGRTIHEFKWRSRHFNHYHYEYALPADALTGKWRVRFKHPASTLKEYAFVVAEFLPERMKLALESPDPKTIRTSDTPQLFLKGDFLYGAPAAGSKADADIRVRPARELFKEIWPGYEFGDITDTRNLSFKTDRIVLDEAGKGRLTLKNEWKDAASPLWLTANASLYDSGGRPVVRSRSWQIWPARSLVGIRLLAENDRVDGDTNAQFEIIVTDPTGRKMKADHLKAVVIKEHREYFWEYRHGQWQWQFTSQSYPVDRFVVDIPAEGSARINIPVEWGGYRLEITHPDTGLVSSRRFWAGWHPDSNAAQSGINRPDRVELVLDKPAYRPGETVSVTVNAPNGGTGYLFVESDTNLLTLPVDIPVQGKTVRFDMDPAWNRHDLYLSALIIRNKANPAQGVADRLPKRAVGLIHLPLDRTDRELAIRIEAPLKIEPNQTIDVGVTVKNADAGIPKDAWVTLAAVDVGILNLSGFNTPSPHDYFFQNRAYRTQLHDVYQRLISANKGSWGTLRFGGDAPTLSRGGDRPSTEVQILAISKQAVKTDESGRARFNLDIPDFNGKVRLMAIGHTAREFGSSEQEMTIAAPLVAQITMPRFLSFGDQANLVIDLHNMTDTGQTLALNLDTAGPVKLTGTGSRQAELAGGKKTSFIFPVFAQNRLEQTRIRLNVTGLVVDNRQKEVNRTWTLGIRPAYPALAKAFKQRLKPSDSFIIDEKETGNMIPETIDIAVMAHTSPPIHITEHIRQLTAYPYGCLEQITSGIFPHVILSRNDFKALGVSGEDAESTDKKIRLGIQRLMEKQKSSGGFGLWSANGMESHWLTCYVTDFLLHAQQAGYDVPSAFLSKAIDRLKTYVRRPRSIRPAPYVRTKEYTAAMRAYAAFVLARAHAVTLGDARALYASVKNELTGPLGHTHAGLALTLAGDQHTGPQVLQQALSRSRDETGYYGDYGSNLRDLAVSYYLLSSFYPRLKQRAQLLVDLQAELEKREWLSTQERNALVLAGSISLKKTADPWQAEVKKGNRITRVTHSGLQQISSFNGESANGFEIKNTGQNDIYISAMLSGFPDQKPEPVSDRIQINRRYLTLSGKEILPENRPALKSGDRMIVELSFIADQRMPNCLIADLLPAGFELEDPNLSGSTLIDEIKIDEKRVSQWHGQYKIRHTEYRDDRFAAALDIPAKQNLRIFYPVRLVSPGTFQVPPPLAEDMYRPYIRAIGDSPGLIIITRP